MVSVSLTLSTATSSTPTNSKTSFRRQIKASSPKITLSYNPKMNLNRLHPDKCIVHRFWHFTLPELQKRSNRKSRKRYNIKMRPSFAARS
jgi:hypothetical protein